MLVNNSLTAELLLARFTKLLFLSLFTNPYTITFIGDTNEILSKALIATGYAVTLFSERTTVYSTCYIVYFRKVEDTMKLFHDPDIFLPNQQIVVFISDYCKFDVSLFREFQHLKSNYILVVTGFTSKYYAKVTDTRTNTTLANFITTQKEDDSFKIRKIKPNFEKDEVIICTFSCPPFIRLNDQGAVYGGIEKYLLEHIPGNFSVQWKILPKLSWMLAKELLQNSSCDISLSGHQILTTALYGLDMTITYSSDRCTLLVPKPKLLPKYSFVFQPFNLGVWASLPVVVATTSLILKFIQRTNYIGTLVAVSGTMLLNSNGPQLHRSIFFLLNILALYLTAAYSGGFATNLQLPKYFKPIETFKDVYEQSLVFSYPNMRIVLNMTRLEYSRKIAASLFRPLKQSELYMAHVINGVIFPEDDGLPLWKKKTLKLLQENVQLFQYIIPLRKNSPYTQLYKNSVQKFMEHGLIDLWFRFSTYEDYAKLKDTEGFLSYYEEEVTKKYSLSVAHLQGAFYVLFVGHLLAGIAMLFEITNRTVLGTQ